MAQTTIPAPEDFTATAGDGYIDLSWSWDAEDTPAGYAIGFSYFLTFSVGDQRLFTPTTFAGSGSDRSHRINTAFGTTLSNGRQYSIFFDTTATKVGEDDIGAPRVSTSATPNIAAPTGLTATAGDGQVTLSWTAPSVSTITGYQYKRDSENWASAGTASPYIVTSLTNGTSYTFKVRAVGAGGSGTASASVTGTPNLAAPTGLTATAGDGQVTLSWTAPSVSTITGYQYKRDSQAWASAGTSSPYIVTGLVNGTSYTFKVRAVGAGGNGMESGSATGTPTAPPPQPPQQPQQPPQQPADSTPPADTTPVVEINAGPSESLTVQRIDARTVTLSWEVPTVLDAQTIMYRYSIDGGQTWTSTGSTDTSITITQDGVGALSADQFKIRAMNQNADGSASFVIIFATAIQQRRILIQECPVGWVRSDGFAGRTRRVLLYEVNLEMDMSNPVSIYKPVWVAIYVHPDEGLENLDSWKLQVALPYNQHRDYLLTAENSVVVDAGFVEGGFAFIENPEADPFPMAGIGFTGSPAPGFDYRLYDETGKRVDFGISCYKRGDIFQVLKEMEDPRVLRKVLLETLDWDAHYLRSEWTVPVPVNAPGAPSLHGVNLVGKWADLKKQ